MIDEKFRLFGKVSIVDVVFAVLLVVFVMAAIQFSAPKTVSAKQGDTTIRYTAELYKKAPDFINNVKIGDVVYDTEKGYEIGTIVDVYQAPYKEEVPDLESGTIKRAQVGDLIFIYIVIEANAQVTDSATKIGQYEVMVGKEAFIRSKNFAAGAYFVKLEK